MKQASHTETRRKLQRCWPSALLLLGLGAAACSEATRNNVGEQGEAAYGECVAGRAGVNGSCASGHAEYSIFECYYVEASRPNYCCGAPGQACTGDADCCNFKAAPGACGNADVGVCVEGYCTQCGEGACVVNGTYCGGNRVAGNPNWLYRATSTDCQTALVLQCPRGCRPTSDGKDACRDAGCTVGAPYCGGNQVDGNSAYLYRCDGPGEQTLLSKCEGRGCQVQSGATDACK